MKVGVLFIDLNTTDQVHHKAEILQIGAKRLTNRKSLPEYSEFAYPKGRIQPGATDKHGIYKSHGALYRDNENLRFFQKEKYLIQDFNDFLLRWDKVYLIYYSPWKWSMLNTALNRYAHSQIEEPEILGIDLMQMMKENRHDLGLDRFSMDHIIDMYDDKYYESQEDALDNAMALRRCAKEVARQLDCNVKDFLNVE